MKHILNIFFDQQDIEVMEEHLRRFVKQEPRTHQVVMKRLVNELAHFPQPAFPQALQVRLGDAPDAMALVELEKRGYDGYLAWSLENFQEDLLSNPYAVYLLLVDSNDRLYGFISGRFLARKAHISHLIIDPAYQGFGLGKYLLRRWIALVENQGIPRIDLEVNANNLTAIGLYQAHGFQQTGYVEAYYVEKGQDALQMQRVSRHGN